MSTEIDFEEDTKANLTEDTLKNISELAAEHNHINERLAKYEEVAKELQARLTQIETVTLPDLMSEANMKEFKLGDGTEIKIDEIFKGSIPSMSGIAKAKGDKRDELIERRDEALTWLRENGGSAIIKNEFVFSLGKGNDEAVDQLKEVASKMTLPWSNDENVHANSLNSFLKDKRNNGDEIPFDTFSVYTANIAKIKQPK